MVTVGLGEQKKIDIDKVQMEAPAEVDFGDAAPGFEDPLAPADDGASEPASAPAH